MLRAAALALDLLVDLAPARAAAFGAALAAEGVEVSPTTLAQAAVHAGDVGDEHALRAVLSSPGPGAPDDVTVALAAHRAERAFGDRLRHGGVVLADGAAGAVEALAARLRIAAVTRLRRTDAAYVLEAAGLTPAIGAIVAGDDRGLAGRPEAGWTVAFARLAGRLPGLTGAQVVALVGSAAGVAAARAAGLRTVCVGPGADAAPASASPHYADARLPSLAGLTPAALACALDLPPHPRTPPLR